MADAVVSELRRIPGPGPGPTPATRAWPAGRRGAADLPSATERWGEFRIVREIGRGGMGVVCEAYQGSLNRHVALKFLPEHGDLARFRREARAAGRLHHTHIVPVFGVGEHARAALLRHAVHRRPRARRGAQGARRPPTGRRSRPGSTTARRRGSASRRPRRWPMPTPRASIHRDIKPSNLLLDERGTVWVTDFGLAHDASDTSTLTHTGDFLGTLRYMAPERFDGRGDARADIYGLGVTLYELACGRPAYAEADRAVLIHQILHQDPPRPRQLDPRIAAGPGDDRAQGDGAGPGAAVRDGRGAGRGPAAVPRGPADPGASESAPGSGRAVVPAEQGGRRPAGGAGGGVPRGVRRRDAAVAARRRPRRPARQRQRRPRPGPRRRVGTADPGPGRDRAARLRSGAWSWPGRGDVDEGLLWMAEALRETPAERPDVARMLRANLAGWDGPGAPPPRHPRASAPHPTRRVPPRRPGHPDRQRQTARPGSGTRRPAGRSARRWITPPT